LEKSIANAGADAVKFQTHIAAAESTPGEPWRVRFSTQDASRYDYWKRMEFSEAQWEGLKRHAADRELLFLSSPFSVEAVELLERVGVAAWKIASGEVSNAPLFERLAATSLPVFLSTGMSPLSEIDAAVSKIREHDLPIVVMQCTSSYPCPPEKVGLNMLGLFRERYSCPVGLSDHSGTIYPGIAAATLGCEVIEVHVTLSRDMFGPDVPVSLTPTELAQLVDGVRFINKTIANPIDKDEMAHELAPLRNLFTKSVVTRTKLPAGTILKAEHLTVKKPGTGIPAKSLSTLIGSRLIRTIEADELVRHEDLEVIAR
jgi:N-acetylneuraminate synthase